MKIQCTVVKLDIIQMIENYGRVDTPKPYVDPIKNPIALYRAR